MSASLQALHSWQSWLERVDSLDWQSLTDLRGWYPVTLSQAREDSEDANEDANESVYLYRMNGTHFTEPFFEDSLRRVARHERAICRVPLTALANAVGKLQCIAPTAFVFHVSRCGSTLMTQMLSALPIFVVISEPPVIDAYFSFRHHQANDQGKWNDALLVQLIAMLAQKRHKDEQHVVLKLDSWHMPWMPLLYTMFPQTRIVLLYREPQQVLASHQRQAGMHMVPGLIDTGRLSVSPVDLNGLAAADLPGYRARVLTAIYASAVAAVKSLRAVDAMNERIKLVNYNTLPDTMLNDLLPWLGVELDAAEKQAMLARTRYHAKNTAVPFKGDPVAGDSVPQQSDDADTQRLAMLYAALEAL